MTMEDLKAKSITELQALAYQQLVVKAQAERSLQVIEQIIIEKREGET